MLANNSLDSVDPEGLWPWWPWANKQCCKIAKDIAEDAANKIWDKLKGNVKDQISNHLGSKTMKDAVDACNRLPCLDHNDPNYAITCMLCSIYKCAKDLPASAAALDNCLKSKFMKCLGGEDP